MHQLVTSSVFLAVALFWHAAPTRAQTEAEEPCANKKASIGEYRNLHHGFSIIIPAGLKGYWTSLACDSAQVWRPKAFRRGNDCICTTDHGRRIPLATGAMIEVIAFYDPMDFEVFLPNAEHNEILALRREKDVSKVKRLRSGWFRLADVNAHRYAIQFVRDKKMFISDNVHVLYEHVAYDLSLQTMADRYETDKKLFDEIITSWRWTQRTE